MVLIGMELEDKHLHKCPKPDCGFVWGHDGADESMSDLELNEFHHTCPRCGSKQRYIYSGSEKAKPFYYIFGYMTNVDNACLEHPNAKLLKIWDGVTGVGICMCESCVDLTLIPTTKFALKMKKVELFIFDRRKENHG